MKLLSTDLSPFAARVRAQIYTKGLNSQGMRIKIEEPDPPLRSEGFKASYALGKVPVLILDDDSHIGESWVIMNYLEDLYPETNLRPHHPLDKAYMGLFQAFADNHLRDQLFPLFAMLMNPDAGGDTDAAAPYRRYCSGHADLFRAGCSCSIRRHGLIVKTREFKRVVGLGADP